MKDGTEEFYCEDCKHFISGIGPASTDPKDEICMKGHTGGYGFLACKDFEQPFEHRKEQTPRKEDAKMGKKRMVSKEGNENCEHKWSKKNKDYEEVFREQKDKSYYAQFYVVVRTCGKCKREELVSGHVIEPKIPGVSLGGTFGLDIDGSNAEWIE